MAGRTDLYRRSKPQHCVSQLEKCVHQCGWGLGAGMYDLESRSRERTALGSEETAGGDWREELHS